MNDIPETLTAIADAIRDDIKQERAKQTGNNLDHQERITYLSGELYGILQAYDLIEARAELQRREAIHAHLFRDEA